MGGNIQIAIAGAGISGAYLYRLLEAEGHDVTMYDIEHKTTCGINPCAWATSKGFQELVERAGLKPEDYILRIFDHIWFDEMKLKAYMLTIDKPKLINDLLGDAEVIEYDPERFNGPSINDYDRIIDATGVARAFLPPITNDLISHTYQYRVSARNEPAEMRFKVGKVGYAWKFPLSDSEFHVGAGSLVDIPIAMLKDNNWLYTHTSGSSIKCVCNGSIRMSGPELSRPFISHNIWGVGEAIGCVSPLTGDGIIHGMKSALLLFKNIYSGIDYVDSIHREFSWMDDERKALDRLKAGKSAGVGGAIVLRRNTRRMGMKLGLYDAFRLLWRARK